MKLYVPGRESDKRVRILIKLTKITSNDIIAALRAHLVKGWTEELAAYTYDVDISNLKRALRRINDVIGLHNQLSDLNLTEQGKLTPTQLRLKEAVDNCNHSAYFIAKKSKVDPEKLWQWITGAHEPRGKLIVEKVLDTIYELNLGQ